jgi:hypothetical protein
MTPVNTTCSEQIPEENQGFSARKIEIFGGISGLITCI